MEKKFIYATNRSQVMYFFRIVGENETEYLVKDDCTNSYALSQVIFFINKENLCQARCEDKTWEFIVKEDFFASFNLDDVKKEYNNREIAIILQNIQEKEQILSTLEDSVKDFKQYNYVNSFNDFNLGDTMFILAGRQLFPAKVVSFYSVDKVNFVPNISSNSVGLEEYYPLSFNDDNQLCVTCWEDDYDNCSYRTYKVFLTKEDYEIYKENQQNEEIIEFINETKQQIARHKKDLIKLGYNGNI